MKKPRKNIKTTAAAIKDFWRSLAAVARRKSPVKPLYSPAEMQDTLTAIDASRNVIHDIMNCYETSYREADGIVRDPGAIKSIKALMRAAMALVFMRKSIEDNLKKIQKQNKTLNRLSHPRLQPWLKNGKFLKCNGCSIYPVVRSSPSGYYVRCACGSTARTCRTRARAVRAWNVKQIALLQGACP